MLGFRLLDGVDGGGDEIGWIKAFVDPTEGSLIGQLRLGSIKPVKGGLADDTNALQFAEDSSDYGEDGTIISELKGGNADVASHFGGEQGVMIDAIEDSAATAGVGKFGYFLET